MAKIRNTTKKRANREVVALAHAILATAENSSAAALGALELVDVLVKKCQAGERLGAEDLAAVVEHLPVARQQTEAGVAGLAAVRRRLETL